MRKATIGAALLIALFLVLIPSGKKSMAEDQVAKDLNQIKKADQFDDQVIGEAPEVSANYKAFSNLLKAKVPVSKLEKLLETATPAGKLYAAVLINKQNSKKGKAAFEKLSKENATVDYQSGCKGASFKVSEVADSFLKKGHFLNFSLKNN